MRLSTDEFEKLVAEALSDIPVALTEHMRGLVVDVERVPDRRTCRRVGIRHPQELLGLYHGIPLPERSIEHTGPTPDRVVIYQRNIERMCRGRAEMLTEIRKTVFHEVGHHFGLDEGELAALGF